MQVYECILSLLAGVGVFILAMKLMSDSLSELAGERMKKLLQKIASNRIKGVLVGALVCAIIQSSSATTVMVIGFVNADVMDLNQAAAIIIGSNIGTTVTGVLASLESLNISLYLSLLVFIGIMLAFIKYVKKIGNLLTGLGMIFVGLKMMSSACDNDTIKKSLSQTLEKLEFPLLLEFLGIIFTCIIQSSSAMTGIVIVMVGNGAMTIKNGLFITLGANIGTCLTALIGAIGGNLNAKRTGLIHLIFNVSGCIIFTPILWIFSDSIISFLEYLSKEDEMKIAYFHLFFNTLTACITTPLIQYLVKLVKFLIKEKESPMQKIEWFIKDKEGLLDMRPSSNSLNLNITEDNIGLVSDNSDEDINGLILNKEKKENFVNNKKDTDDSSNEENKNDIIEEI